jgi:hypothetical protein
MAKLTLNVDPDVIKKGKKYAYARGQSLSAVVENYIKSITLKEEKSRERKIPAAIRKIERSYKIAEGLCIQKGSTATCILNNYRNFISYTRIK